MMSNDVQSNKTHWDIFYKNNAMLIPSQFCAMVATDIPKASCVVELGCGNGRDALFFASKGHKIHAVDLSREAVTSCNISAGDIGLTTAHFYEASLAKLADIDPIIRAARSGLSGDNLVFYSRFVMHAIDDAQEAAFMDVISKLMRRKERVYFEFRSKEDADLEKTFDDHYRRFIDTEAFTEKMTQDFEFDVLYSITGKGMARFKDEDPFVSRLVFEKR